MCHSSSSLFLVASLFLCVGADAQRTRIAHTNDPATSVLLIRDANVFAHPNTSAEVLATYPSGSPLHVVRDTGSFYLVESFLGGTKGYVLHSRVALVNGEVCGDRPDEGGLSSEVVAYRRIPSMEGAVYGHMSFHEFCLYGKIGPFRSIARPGQGHVGFVLESELLDRVWSAPLSIEPSYLTRFDDLLADGMDPETAAELTGLGEIKSAPEGTFLAVGDRVRIYRVGMVKPLHANVALLSQDSLTVWETKRYHSGTYLSLRWSELRRVEKSLGKSSGKKRDSLNPKPDSSDKTPKSSKNGGSTSLVLGTTMAVVIAGATFIDQKKKDWFRFRLCWEEECDQSPEKKKDKNVGKLVLPVVIGTSVGLAIKYSLRKEEWAEVPLSISPVVSQDGHPGVYIRLTLN